MCFYYGAYGLVPKISDKQMSVDQIIKFIKDLRNHNPNIKFVLTGGEVFLRNDLENLFKFLIKEKIKYNIITNGTIMNKDYFKLIAQSNALNISFSLDGSEKINDYIRGAVGSFKKTIENIKYFNSINEKQIPVTIATTISKNNFNYLANLIPLVKKLKVRLTIIHLQFLEKIVISKHSKLTKVIFGKPSDCMRWSADKFSKEDVDAIIKNIDICKKIAHENQVDIDFLPNLGEKDIYSYYLNGNYCHEDTCNLPFRQIVINPFGKVYPCFPERFDYSIGNVKNENVIDIINNKGRKKFLSIIKQRGIFPACLRCCSLKLNKPEKPSKFTYIVES